jgi:hypothetical protein
LKPVLFLVTAASSYRLLRLVADELVRQGRTVVYLYERGADATFAIIKQDADAQGMQALTFEDAIIAGRQPPDTTPALARHPEPRRARRLARIVSMIKAPRLTGFLSLLLPAAVARRVATSIEFRVWGKDMVALRDYRLRFASELSAAAALLARIDPAAMVVSEDGVSARLPLHAAAREAGIRVAEVPYGYGVQEDLEIALQNKQARGELESARGLCGRLIERFAPQWIKRGALAGSLMFPAPHIVAAESLGLTLRDAWIIHGGFSARLFVESEQMLEVYRGEGIPENKLRLTGTPYCDVMMRSLESAPAATAAFRQPRRIVRGRTSVLVSWPPNYHGDRGASNEFPTYREMSVAILGWLKGLQNCDVLVSLHPATLADDRQALADAGIPLTDRYVIDLIPQHDVFVTYYSSTIRWAIAAGKPVVNYDAYGLGLDVFATAPGVATVRRADELRARIMDLAGSDESFAAVAAQQIAVAPRWGAVDGGSTARIVAELDKMA